MPTCRNMFAMPKVRASSATTGTTRGPELSRPSSALPSMRTIAIVVDISLPFAFDRELRPRSASAGRSAPSTRLSAFWADSLQGAARRACRYCISGLSSAGL